MCEASDASPGEYSDDPEGELSVIHRSTKDALA